MERSSDQVVRPVNRDALDKWVGHIPADVRADMAELAPMLSVLGYDPWANPPRYSADDELGAPPPPRKPDAHDAHDAHDARDAHDAHDASDAHDAHDAQESPLAPHPP